MLAITILPQMVNTVEAPGLRISNELPVGNTFIPVDIIASQNVSVNVPTDIDKPDYIPTFIPMDCYDKSGDIWKPCNPERYITPENPWVRYYASQLYIDLDGRIRYKNKPIPYIIDWKGNVEEWIDEPFLNNYISDNEQFSFPPNNDVWVMPEYYLTHGMNDDCDGWAVTVTSLMLSGEMSLIENEKYIKQVIPAKLVLGYDGNNRDAWVEYQVHGKIWITSTGKYIVPTGSEKTFTLFEEGVYRNNQTHRTIANRKGVFGYS